MGRGCLALGTDPLTRGSILKDYRARGERRIASDEARKVML
jgi:hypothetical protein